MNAWNEGKNLKKNGNTTNQIVPPTTTTIIKPGTQKEPNGGDDSSLKWTNQARQNLQNNHHKMRTHEMRKKHKKKVTTPQNELRHPPKQQFQVLNTKTIKFWQCLVVCIAETTPPKPAKQSNNVNVWNLAKKTSKWCAKRLEKIRRTSECICNVKMQTIKQENVQKNVQHAYEHSLKNAKIQ